jgi:phage terminase Nu1 subunit (DNA packaging protein)
MEVTTVKMAELLGITSRRINQLSDEGVLPKSGRNLFNISETVPKWIEYQLGLEREKFRKNDMEIGEARRRREVAEARLKEIELDRVLGELVTREMVEAKWNTILSKIKTKILSIGTSISPVIAMRPASYCQDKISDALREVLHELHDSSI